MIAAFVHRGQSEHDCGHMITPTSLFCSGALHYGILSARETGQLHEGSFQRAPDQVHTRNDWEMLGKVKEFPA